MEALAASPSTDLKESRATSVAFLLQRYRRRCGSRETSVEFAFVFTGGESDNYKGTGGVVDPGKRRLSSLLYLPVVSPIITKVPEVLWSQGNVG